MRVCFFIKVNPHKIINIELLMLYRLIIFILLLGQGQIFGQTIINGLVLDTLSHPIEYASVGILNKPIGTVTDKSGAFKLVVNDELLSINDSLKFSIIGYYPKTISLNQISSQFELPVILHQKVERLSEVVVKACKRSEKRIGSHSKSLLNMAVKFSISEYPNQNLGSEIGRKFSIKHKNTSLKHFRFFIYHNDYDTISFRVNVYSIKKLRPNKNLLTKNILCEISNKKTGWVNLDLSEYNIVINDDVIVAIEWIYKSAIGSNLSLPLVMPTTHMHFYKFGSQNKWKRFYSMTTLMELTVSN